MRSSTNSEPAVASNLPQSAAHPHEHSAHGCAPMSALQFDHRQRGQRMAAEPIESQLQKTPMKPGIRPFREQACNERTLNAEPSQPTRHVDPVRAPESLDERIW